MIDFNDKIALCYDNVLLTPMSSTLPTRSVGDTSVTLTFPHKKKLFKFNLPVIPANMATVVNTETAQLYDSLNIFYVMHRLENIDVYKFVEYANNADFNVVSISTGVNEDTELVLKDIHKGKHRVDFITIDVAHGHHSKVYDRIKLIESLFPEVIIIAGNVTTYDGTMDLFDAGADIVKVGIGQGSICTTRLQTGFSMPMVTAIDKCWDALCEWRYKCASTPGIFKRKYLIADGGVKHIGDIAKAIRFGADMVMTGRLFAQCIDSPAEIKDGKKVYYGSTSFQAKKTNKHIEGRELEIAAGCTIREVTQNIKEALQSSISYAGGKDLSAIKHVDFTVQLNNN